MKVKDLAAMLLQIDPESEISFEMASGCCGDWEDLEVVDTDFLDISFGGKGSEYLVRIQFAPLPGYKSCIQASGTKKSDQEYWSKHKNGQNPGS